MTEKVIDMKFKRVCIKSPQRNSRFGIAVVNLTLFDLKVDWLILLVSFSQFVPLYIDCSVSIWIENQIFSILTENVVYIKFKLGMNLEPTMKFKVWITSRELDAF